MEESIFLQFPFELLEYILKRDELSMRDICNVGCTNSKLRTLVTDSNQLWKAKFYQRWPNSERYKDENLAGVQWLEECKSRWMINYRTDQELEWMTTASYHKEELVQEDFGPFVHLIEEHRLAPLFIIDHLLDLINDQNGFKNLTIKYYAEKVLRFVRQQALEGEWERLKDASPDEQILEKGAVIVAQWCQPTIEVTYKQIREDLDRIADDVLKEVDLVSRGCHPVLKASKEERDHWATHNIFDNQWKCDENKMIINCTSSVLFKQMKFHGSEEFYYVPENSFINKVLELKRGIPITLSIVFEAVTRRLGVKCEAVSFPGHFLLRWRENYRLYDGLVCEFFYIDVFNEGKLFSKSNCPRFVEFPRSRCPVSDLFQFGPANIEEVVERLAHNLEVANRQRSDMVNRNTRLKSVLELLHMLNPTDLGCLLQLIRFYVYMNMDIRHPLNKINRLMNNADVDDRGRGQASHIIEELHVYQTKMNDALDADSRIVKSRSGINSSVKYAVGMVMHHRQYHYKCVIFAWDPICAESTEWMQQMNINSLARKGNQPYYGVLVNDGTQRYAAEDNLEMCKTDTLVEHHLVGKYFTEFCKTHYMPNEKKRAEYPEDERVRDELLKSNYLYPPED